DALASEVAGAGVFPANGKGRRSKLRASLRPGEGLARVALHSNCTGDRFEVFRFRVERRSSLREDLVQCIERRATRRSADASDRRAAAGASRDRIPAVTYADLHRVHRQAERVSHDDVQRGSRPGSKILRSHLQLYRAVRLNRQVTVACVTLTAPGVNRKAEPSLDRPRTLIASRVPILLPPDQVGGGLQLVAVDLRALAGHLDVLHE